MSISSINTNLAALLAQSNIGNATTATSNAVAALSSGNRIVNASTDVAALAAGTALVSQVSILNTALTVASQGSSLLQVADGGLAQIQSILQRQQTIATSAQSGSLSTTQRGFLDQEFQSLTSEIDQLAGSTNFNGVNLIDGSIQGGASISTNTTSSTTALPGAASIASITGAITAGDGVTISVGGQPSVTLHFGTTSGTVGIGATAGDSAQNLAAALNNSNLPQFANIRFSASGTSTGTVSAYYAGSATALTNIPAVTVSSAGTNTNISLSNATFGATTIGTFTADAFGDLGVGDTFTVGTHTVSFIANGATPSGAQVALGGTLATSLTALKTYLNGANFPDLSGVTFSSTGTTLAATFTGSGTAPTISTSYTSITAPALTTTSGTATTSGAVVATFSAANSYQAGDTFSLTGLGGPVTLTATTGAGVSGISFQIGATQATTLANIVAAFSAGNKTTLGLSAITTSGLNISATTASGTQAVTSAYVSEAARSLAGVSGQALTASGITGLGAGATSAVGTLQGSLFVNSTGTSVTNYGSGIDLSGVANNASFIGKFDGTGTIGAISATYVNTGSAATSGVTFSSVVGNDTYTTGLITNTLLTSTTAPVSLSFTGTNNVSGTAEGGSFSINLQPQTSSITSQGQASQLATGIIAGLGNVSASQNRSVLSYNNNYSATVANAQTATLANSSLTLNSTSFANPLISNVTVSAPSTGSSDAKISVTIDGNVYSTIANIGNTFATNSEITLQNVNNPSQQLTLKTGNIAATGAASGIAIDVSSASNAAAFQTALSSALGISSAKGGLSFQVGATSADNINITLGSAKSSSLFSGLTLDVKTQADAVTAATAVTAALNTVTSLRATVGAGEERFNFASSAIQSAAQNQNAARGTLLDTDVSATSTAFATAQVQLQAGIAVLAQANQLQQNLLKLIA